MAVCSDSSTWEHSFVWIEAFIKDLNLNQFAVTQEKWIIMKNRPTIMGITNRERVRSRRLKDAVAAGGGPSAAQAPPPGASASPMSRHHSAGGREGRSQR